MLCTSGFMVTSYLPKMDHIEVHCMSTPLQRLTSLRRRRQANDPAASCWLSHILVADLILSSYS